ncbi:transcriptional regulator YeiL [Levilactobacillus namurensis]|nr:transcriptional regulator YeiL [Levilactobacillus namurensis]
MHQLKNTTLIQQLATTSQFNHQFSTNLATKADLVLISAGDQVVTQGKAADTLWYLARGRTKLTTTLANGKIALIDFFTTPCFIGEMEFIDHQPTYTFTVTALSDCWCFRLPVAPYRQRLLQDSHFLQQLCQYFVHKNYRNIQTATRNQSFPLVQRLAAFILLTAHNDQYTEKNTQVAEYLGVSYRHLLYVFSQLVKDGSLTRTHPGYHIINHQYLRSLAYDVQHS